MYMDQDNCPIYIGMGRKDRHLICRHLNGQQPYLQNKIRKIGKKNVKVHFLHKNLTQEEAIYWECYWIAYFGRKCNGTGQLYNLTEGGEVGNGDMYRGKKRPKEVGQKISATKLGHEVNAATRQKIADTLKGFKHTDEMKRKVRTANKNRAYHPHSKETKQKIADTLKDKFVGENAYAAKLNRQQVKEIRNKYIPKEYTLNQLAKEYGVSVGTISNIINRRCYQ